MDRHPDRDRQGGTDLLERPKNETRHPPRFSVILMNDDYTPMEFVIHVLRTVFKKSADEAIPLVMEVHRKGLGVVDVYTREIAETKVAEAVDLARANDHPLMLKIEPVE